MNEIQFVLIAGLIECGNAELNLRKREVKLWFWLMNDKWIKQMKQPTKVEKINEIPV